MRSYIGKSLLMNVKLGNLRPNFMKCMGGGMCQLGHSHYLSVPDELEYTQLEFIETHVNLENKTKGIIFFSSLQIGKLMQRLNNTDPNFHFYTILSKRMKKALNHPQIML